MWWGGIWHCSIHVEEEMTDTSAANICIVLYLKALYTDVSIPKDMWT
jgi:hypothetical protein